MRAPLLPSSPQKYDFAMVWRPYWQMGGDALKVDVESSTKGAFVDACTKVTLGAPYAGSLPGRAFDNHDWDWCRDLQKAEDPRAELAKQHGVRGCYTVWRDGAVYEFGMSRPFDESPAQLVSTFGGTTGFKAAGTAVMAAVKFGAAGKKKKDEPIQE